jgi:hypothetical protein
VPQLSINTSTLTNFPDGIGWKQITSIPSYVVYGKWDGTNTQISFVLDGLPTNYYKYRIRTAVYQSNFDGIFQLTARGITFQLNANAISNLYTYAGSGN